jgi:hypothetical protein
MDNSEGKVGLLEKTLVPRLVDVTSFDQRKDVILSPADFHHYDSCVSHSAEPH